MVEYRMGDVWHGMATKWKKFLVEFMNDKRCAVNNPMGAVEWMSQLLYVRSREAQLGVDFGVKPSKAVEELFDKRVAKFVPEVIAARDTKTCLDIAQRVYDTLKDLIDQQKAEDEQKKKEQEKNAKKQKGQKGQSGSSGDAGSDSEVSDDDASDGSQSGEGDQESDSDDKGAGKDADSKDADGSDKYGSGVSPEADDDKEGDETDGDGDKKRRKGADKKGKSKAGKKVMDNAGDGDASGTDDGADAKDSDASDGKADEGSDPEDEEDPLSDAAKKLLKEIEKQLDNGDVDGNDIGKQMTDTLNKYADTTGVLKKARGLKENVRRPCVGGGDVPYYVTQGKRMVGSASAKLRTLFISERAPRWTGNLESGRLDVTKLHRIKTGGATSIFKRRTERVCQDSAVSFVLDVSGSMGGEKYTMAASVLTAIAAELERLRVPFEVVSFNTNGDPGLNNTRTVPCNIFLVKAFEEQYARVMNNFGWHGGNGTNELPAIEMASQHLAARKETKKILFIMTDGETSYGNLNDVTRVALKEYVALVKKAGIKVVGFGMIDECVSDYCPEWIHVKDMSNFGNEMYAKLSKYLL